ncbi:hypothetical protein BP6252_12138 [Coleophoma cylindrospora]|uniref:Uncharacterized protein n=1 Tax=Coleophoma cylindrospora TaxID=1849047 RepID=A0A3D8QG26_9HELO|nr:hypothetical protein BP6252_12138 [Coleophoma cylindrospora]
MHLPQCILRIALTFLVAFPRLSMAFSTAKFQSWYPYYGGVLDIELFGIEAPGYNNCSANYTAYKQAQGINRTNVCYNVYDCLFSGLLPNEQSNFASAQVFLGLTPTLLATIAPSIGEISLLSSQRPLLSFFLALGGPAVFVPRFLGHPNILQSLEMPGIRPPWLQRVTSQRRYEIGLSILQYALAIAAIVNVFSVSYQLGIQTVIAWKCDSSYLPFLWAILPVGIHLIAALAWRISNTMRRVRNTRLQRGRAAQESSSAIGISLIALRIWLQEELQLCINGQKRGYRSDDSNKGMSKVNVTATFPNEGWLSEMLMEFMSVFAFVQVVFGTLVFSSLMFIATIDAVVVVIRYSLSGLLCRAILMFELNGMRVAESEEDEQASELLAANGEHAQ